MSSDNIWDCKTGVLLEHCNIHKFSETRYVEATELKVLFNNNQQNVRAIKC